MLFRSNSKVASSHNNSSNHKVESLYNRSNYESAQAASKSNDNFNNTSSFADLQSFQIIQPSDHSFDWRYEIFSLDNLLRNELIAASIGASIGAVIFGMEGSMIAPGVGTVAGIALGAFTGAVVGGTITFMTWTYFQFQIGTWIDNPITILAPWSQ